MKRRHLTRKRKREPGPAASINQDKSTNEIASTVNEIGLPPIVHETSEWIASLTDPSMGTIGARSTAPLTISLQKQYQPFSIPCRIPSYEVGLGSSFATEYGTIASDSSSLLFKLVQDSRFNCMDYHALSLLIIGEGTRPRYLERRLQSYSRTLPPHTSTPPPSLRPLPVSPGPNTSSAEHELPLKHLPA